MDNDELIRKEMESIVDDIKQMYENSGKKVTGQFADDLEVISSPNRVELWGTKVLAGRPEGGLPPVDKILQWVENRGIQPFVEGQSTTSVAWAIAKSIQKYGTDQERTLKVYEEVITPERIQKILDRVVEFNVQSFVHNITAELTILEKDI